MKILEDFKANNSSQYLHYHAKRFEYLLMVLSQYKGTRSPILEIGHSVFSRIAAQHFDCTVDTLDLNKERQHETGQHYALDLNECAQYKNGDLDLPRYRYIVFAEVIEHLHTAPQVVLRFLHSLLMPGGMLILQTPNALVLHKRIRMLFGQHPYAQISENTKQPNHFRESTLAELKGWAISEGFEILQGKVENYFDYRYSAKCTSVQQPLTSGRLLNITYQFMPENCKGGICLVLQKRP